MPERPARPAPPTPQRSPPPARASAEGATPWPAWSGRGYPEERANRHPPMPRGLRGRPAASVLAALRRRRVVLGWRGAVEEIADRVANAVGDAAGAIEDLI